MCLFNTMVTWQIKNVLSPFSQGPRLPNLAGWWLRMKASHQQNHVTLRSRGHVKNKKKVLSPLSQGLWTSNLARWQLVMREPHPQSHSTIQSVVIWQIKNVISPLSQGLSPPILARWRPKIKTTPEKSCNTSITWSRDKEKTLHLNFRKAYQP